MDIGEDVRSHRWKTLAMLVPVVGALVGCQVVPKQEVAGTPVFFPSPPDKPRLQFLQSFSRPEDLGAKKTGAWEDFILGEPEVSEVIGKPYGIAMSGQKIYVCDVGRRLVEVLDLQKRTFDVLTRDTRLRSPVNIFVEADGTKYVTDPESGAVFVFDHSDALAAVLGKQLDIAPMGIAVRGDTCYVTDLKKQQIVLFHKKTGELIRKIGSAKNDEETGQGQFNLISDLALDKQGNIYVSDRALGQVTKFSAEGELLKTFGFRSTSVHGLVRPKGIFIDRQERMWIVDAGPEVTKIYDQDGRLLVFFGLPGNEPGAMNLPAQIFLDYEHVDLFRERAVPGAELEFIVLVTNQFGPSKINVYGFGSFDDVGDVSAGTPSKLPPAGQAEDAGTAN